MAKRTQPEIQVVGEEEEETSSAVVVSYHSTVSASGGFSRNKRSRRRANIGNTRQQGMLNSNQFSDCFEIIWRSFPDNRKASFTYLDCLWFSLYVDELFKEKVLGWIGGKKIFSKKYVFVPIVMWFLLDIYEAEKRNVTKEVVSKIPLLVPKVPQQRNGEACGCFVLYYISLFMESAPAKSFSITGGYPYFMKENWFTLEDLDGFCKRFKLCSF